MLPNGFLVRAHWSAMVALAEASVALRRTSEACTSLLHEMGQELVVLQDSADPDVRAFVRELLVRLHRPAP
jgi:hypothetical protein